MKPTSTKIGGFHASFIRQMTEYANQCGAYNLAQGFPDFDPPEPLRQRLARAAQEGPHQYQSSWGSEHFRRALAAKCSHFMQVDVNPDTNVVVTAGSTEAMISAVLALTNPGDKMVIFSPYYGNYLTNCLLTECEPIYVELRGEDFRFDEAELERACADPATKVVVLNNPSNPSGKVFSREELETIARLVEKYDLYVVTDDVYEHIYYEPNELVYFATLPGMWERTVSCGSLSKTYAITGWRLGYVVAPPELADLVDRVHDSLTVCAAAPLMEAATAGLELPWSYYDQLREDYTHRRELFCSGLDALGVRYIKPEGAYYTLVDISEFGYEDDVEFAHDLARKVGVAPVPGSPFFAREEHRYVRMHFAKSDRYLTEALERLKRIDVLRRS